MVISFDKIYELLTLPSDILLTKFLLTLGWLPVAIVLLWGVKELWMYYIQDVYASKREYLLLAIDIPKGNEQTPKAVEQMFAHLAGAHGSIDLIEKYWHGKTQSYFSLEIVSIEGYTQYLIWTERGYRDLIEAMTYAQYPEAEITEVNDYIEGYPDRFPDEKYDIWGAEWVVRKPNVYPIRTYLHFEHMFSGEFKDPSAALMELFGNLRKGEQCWYQIITTPIGREWEGEGEKEISKVIGEKVKTKRNFTDALIDGAINLISSIGDLIISAGAEEKKEEREEFKMMNLKPAQKKAVEAIQEKVSKIGFEIKIRFIYIAEKDIFNRRRANSFVGIMKQFSMEDLNTLKPDMDVTATSTHYLWKESRLNKRKNAIMEAYKARSNWLGRDPFVLNIEELATLWHFPLEEAVKAPMLQKVPSRKTEAPSYLPVEEVISGLGPEVSREKEEEALREKEEIFSVPKPEEQPQKQGIGVDEEIAQTGPPANLPVG